MLDYEDARGIGDILDGLQCLYDNCNLCEYCNKVQCPYWVEGYELGSCGGYSIVSDAIEALKPRVMTLAEATEKDVVWYDWRTLGVRPAKVNRVPSKTGTYRVQRFGDIDDWVHADEYGEYWRCWTSRPTDEQRKAIPWNK